MSMSNEAADGVLQSLVRMTHGVKVDVQPEKRYWRAIPEWSEGGTKCRDSVWIGHRQDGTVHLFLSGKFMRFQQEIEKLAVRAELDSQSTFRKRLYVPLEDFTQVLGIISQVTK
ncbi:hypothetical protein J4N45_14435 [Vibrio sp. SCSIO 43140]|uniref:hypothetical protein n=1 Tax=Vibrio sp. SCSIO 43140 TaxID=2819100 RepID=UPI002075494A|nr:hypothetical protein [Vibrio sp. SCSIO 43140]USD58813.1 hypothetical protein J4N45_09750 [Vibrio sp. SCSIO 43140]USD59147.1 hypothetical protein J4N45_11455 [Vibrio sp. SCSIO 43140]USD59700.1 hypothetical protein J4N45_14435 [Vibrio sp. SCSIO 43140]